MPEPPSRDPSRERLTDPADDRPRRRRLFDPVAGRVRRLERSINRFVSREVHPRLTWIHGTYDRTLRERLQLSEATLTLPELGAGLDGCRVLLATDLHAGPLVSEGALRATVDRLASLAPDLILIGGDFVTARVEEVEIACRALAGLSAPLGVFGVPGNHDHYACDLATLDRGLADSGITLLVNRSVSVSRARATLRLAGVDDWNVGRPDLDAALVDCRPGEPIVLLSHNPDAAIEAARRGVAAVLSGHTHGGQIRVPGLPVLVRMSRYRLDEGRYRVGNTEVVVSRGLGVVGLPIRIACPPEAVLLTLRSAVGRSKSTE
jgi:predicted MPP superfamily phosphohydrolase